MKVAWLLYGSLAQPTGGYVYDRLIVEGLSRAGDQVEIVSVTPGESGRSLAARSCEGAPDVVVGDALAVLELGPAFEHLATPRVLLVHHLTSWEAEVEDRDALAEAESRALRASTALIATSHATARRIAAESSGRTPTVVWPGADRLPRLPRTPSAFVTLLSIGALMPRKRLDLVLRAFRSVDSDDARLRVIGDPERDAVWAEGLERQMARDARVEFLGVLSDAELADELARADALVLASSLEGYGMVLTEACHAGLPSIVARSAALAEVTGASDDVQVFEDAAELARLLDRFIRDSSLRAAMQASAAARAPGLPRWADSVARFRAALSAVLGGG